MNVIRLRKFAFALSGLLVLASLVILAIPPSLKPGIDFTGGAAFTVTFAEPVQPNAVEQALANIGHPDAIVQPSVEEDGTFGRTYFVRVGEIEPTIRDAEGNVVTPGGRERIEEALNNLDPTPVPGEQFANFEAFETISGVVAGDNVRNSIIAVIVASVLILLYVWWAFRRVPSPIRYGVAAVVALLHDVIIVLGLFSLLGKVADVEINAMFITGVLTLIGYSVNDTIVVFDRIRENILKFPALDISETVNLSVRETIGRSLNTSITLLLVIAALLLFGANSIQPLLYVLGVGVIVGTYSSIFIASLILVAWEQGEIGGFFSRIPLLGRRRRQPA